MRSWLSALLLMAAACTTPTIPIPPPQVEDVTFALDEPNMTATFEYTGGEPYADGFVYVFNLTQGVGPRVARFDAVGHVMTEAFPGARDDEIDIAFRRDDAISTLCVLLRPPPLSPAELCP
jgi:hypothetical protein